jgi:putative heme-binding domain-containing protein
MLTAVFNPNQSVEPRYVSYVAQTTDGATYTGILESDSGGSVVLLDQEGRRHELLRADIESLRSSGKSLMPEGVENDLSIEDVADLLAYLAAPTQRPPSR